MKPGFLKGRAVAARSNWERIVSMLALAFALVLAGCSGQSDVAPPVFLGTNYAAVVTNAPTEGIPQAGTLALYFYPDGPKGAKSLVWPYLTAQDSVVFERLVVFNGGLSDGVLWKYFPALLAYAGNGKVVEISQLACRKIPDWKPDWTNYTFTVLSSSNQFVRLDASEKQLQDDSRPKRLEVDLDKADILKALLGATTNGQERDYNGMKYLVAP